MSGDATPRPWKIEDPFGDYLSIVVGDETYNWRFVAHVHTDIEKGSAVKPIGKAQMAANAELIVTAVNTFSEREALLREAADYVLNAATSDDNYTPGGRAEAKALIARIRTALGETK